MKKAIVVIGVLVSGIVNAQTSIDTVYTRANALTASTWNYALGYFEFAQKDSADRKLFKRIRAAVANQSNNTVVTIDSIPGKWVMRFVELYLSIPGGEYEESDGKNTVQHFKNKAQLTELIADKQKVYKDRFQAFRKSGKDWAEQ